MHARIIICSTSLIQEHKLKEEKTGVKLCCANETDLQLRELLPRTIHRPLPLVYLVDLSKKDCMNESLHLSTPTTEGQVMNKSRPTDRQTAFPPKVIHKTIQHTKGREAGKPCGRSVLRATRRAQALRSHGQRSRDRDD